MPKPPKILEVINHLKGSDDTRPRVVETARLDPQLTLLRHWQSQRLERTYADLLADPEYAPAGRFFLEDIYAARDFSQRDANAEHLHALLSRFLPEGMLRHLAEAIALNKLTKELDTALLDALVDQLGVTDTITTEQYAQAYRICDNYPERVEQIARTSRILLEVGEGARQPVVGVTLKLARLPAQKAGWLDLYEFLERGYTASRPMRDVKYFVNTIETREMQILDRIYSNHPAPFEIGS